jgi:SAM-dependent methyltransferase
MLPDLCNWWTPERIAAEDAVWLRDQFYFDYAAKILDLAREHGLNTVAEVGCGAGYVGECLQNTGIEYTGYDGSALMIEYAKKKFPHLQFGVHNLRENPMDGDGFKPFDLVCSFAVIKHFHLTDWQYALKNTLKFGRSALVQIQLRTNGQSSVEDGVDVPHNWLNPDAVTAAVEAAGHRVIAMADTGKDTTPYMPNSMEAWLITEAIATEGNSDESKSINGPALRSEASGKDDVPGTANIGGKRKGVGKGGSR